eukprot:g44010.t1
MAENDVDNELLDYEDDEVENQAAGDASEVPLKKDVKGSYVSIHSSGFRDFLLKPELLRAIVDCGFEHPSEGDTFQRNAEEFSAHFSALFFCGYLKFVTHLVNGPSLPRQIPSISFCHQVPYNMSAFPKQFWAWMSCARPSLAWEKQQCLSWLLFNNWNLSPD